MSDLIDRKLGKYKLEARLGEGGMAAVFQSHHPQFHRPVAIKVLPPTIGQDPSFRARFEREGRTIAGLNHPNIIRIYDIDEADGLFYMVMDLLPGGTLESRIRAGGLDRIWSTGVVVKMAEALQYAHARGVIHRDIKPSNILIDGEGQPVLADFGIARLVQGEGEPGLTSAGMVMGTPAYMAPEQLTGGQPDARSDIYSLGVVLYQILAGRAPFTGDTMAVVSAHLTKQPQPLRDHVRDLPAALDAVVLQALEKQPEHRFKSAGVFAQALRNAAADLEPGVVRVASAARDLAAPTFGGVSLPPATPGAGQAAVAAPAQAETVGQKVARYLPIVLGVLGLLLVISLLLKYWAIVVLLAVLIAGGGFIFMYLRASAQGRRAAAETTRAITTASASAAQQLPRPTVELDERPSSLEIMPAAAALSSDFDAADDTPEFPTPDAMTQVVGSTQATSEDLIPTTAAPVSAADDLPPTEVVPAAADLPPTEAVPAADLPPAESPPAISPDQPTAAMPATAEDTLPPTEAVSTSPAPSEGEPEH